MPLDSKLLLRVALGALVFHAAAWGLGLPGFVAIGPQTDPDRATAAGELTLGALALLAALPLWLWRPNDASPPSGPLSRQALLGWSLAHLLIVVLVGTFVTEWGAMLDDEDVYLLQGRLLLDGRVREPFTMLEPQVRQNLLIAFAPGPNGQVYWAGCYAFLTGLLTAPGIALGFPNLLWMPLGAVVVWQGTRVSERLFPEAPAHLVPLLLATSPALIGLSVAKHTSLLITVWSLVAARAFLARERVGDLALGAAVGLAVHSRPLDGAVVGLLAAIALWLDRRNPDAPPLLTRLLHVGAGGLPFLIGLLVYNQAVTGNPSTLPYGLLFEGRPVYGFGETAMGTHDAATALRNTALGFGRLSIWGLALPLVPVAIVTAVQAANRGDRRASFLLLVVLAHYLAYLPAPFGQHASTGISYGIWLVPVMALMLAWLASREARWYARVMGSTVLMSVTLLPYAVWKMNEQQVHNRAPIAAAEALAGKHGKVLVIHHGFETHPSRSHRYTPPVIGNADGPIVWWYDATMMPLRMQGLAAFPELPAYYLGWSDAAEPELIVERLR